MNYKIEHHMFPMVPFHSLGDLHKQIKSDCPTPTKGLAVLFGKYLQPFTGNIITLITQFPETYLSLSNKGILN